MSLLGVMAARNEAGYIEQTLRSLIEEGVEVVLIDHGSIDGTRERAERFLGGGLLAIRDAPWRDVFDLAELLAIKDSIFSESRHDWHVHVDADEWLRANEEIPLAEFLDREVAADAAVVNFREYVFLPPYGVDMWGRDYRRLATSYYTFEPRPRRLMRAWRRGSMASKARGSGHTFRDIPSTWVHDEDLALRHYIGLSWSHAISKRANRVHLAANVAKGWHINRLDLRTAEPVTTSAHVKHADPWDTRHLDASNPSRLHFWEPGFYDQR